jgi:hypothetical protein
VPEHEAGDVIRDELPKTDRALSKTFRDELLEVAPISGDCSRTKPTLLMEIVFIPFLQC